ncbi:MAG TPA: hypothetical protein VHZ76_00715 [Gammaproteobacteria bacterium]|jgi:hypothetical protein|nr:hypothetical protein [Gammaproteobacteria bacterium]
MNPGDLRVFIEGKLESLKKRRSEFWRTAELFSMNRDSHGVWDSAVDVYAIQRAITEIEEIIEKIDEEYENDMS